MASNTVTISGMFGSGHTYFAGSPTVITISGLMWPAGSPFCIVRLYVDYGGVEMGEFHEDTGGQDTATFDIKSALRNIWSSYEFSGETAAARTALTAVEPSQHMRPMRQYTLRVYTEYLADDGVFTVTQCSAVIGGTEYTDIPGGQCLIGRFTEWERSRITDDTMRDVSVLEHTGIRYGDASTKPLGMPERVGRDSITSWTDVTQEGTKTIFYPSSEIPDADDAEDREQGWTGHAPLVLRDSVPYADFLFVNRRGAVETCSAQTEEAMNIDVETKTYARTERPSFTPSRSLLSVSGDPRRSWPMSSGHQTREWTEWWATEFLTARRHWMLYKGDYVPVTVEPAKKSNSVYDRSKQQMTHVDFTVTLALEG